MLPYADDNVERTVHIAIDHVDLEGTLGVPQDAAGVVSRGGRPDLADDLLPAVEAPTLLIVGGRDDVVIQLNEEAKRLIRAEVRLEIVPRATHLFEEPGALEDVARLASDWFSRYL